MQNIIEFNYKRGKVAFNLRFDANSEDHKGEIEKMIEMLDETKDEITSYLNSLE